MARNMLLFRQASDYRRIVKKADIATENSMNPGSAHPKADLLYRLHQNKQRQLLDARRQGNALASSLLEAEARALGEALANLNRR